MNLDIINSINNLNIDWSKIGIFIGIVLLGFVIQKLIIGIFLKKIRIIAVKTSFSFDDVVVDAFGKLNSFFYLFTSLFISIKTTIDNEKVDQLATSLAIIVFTIFGTRIAQVILKYFVEKLINKAENSEGERKHVNSLVTKTMTALFWVIAIILVVQNLGYDISTLVGGLGIAGIAVAFAVQSIFEDVFAYISIYFDKPFKVGDFVSFGTNKGEVKKVGVRSTRITTLTGEELVVPNTDLTSQPIRNFHNIKKRRDVILFSVEYDTPNEKLKMVNSEVEKLFSKYKIVELDRIHLKDFAAFTLDFEMVYYVNSKEYKVLMDIRQGLILDIKRIFEKEGIKFGYPVQQIIKRTNN